MARLLTDRALNRALLARQGLLEPLDQPVVEVVEAIGAVQAQHWPAVSVALWSRMRELNPDTISEAFERRELVVGTLLRRTLHLVSARQHPTYAAVVEAPSASDRRGTQVQQPDDLALLRSELARFAASVPRSGEEIIELVESWVARNPSALREAELARQRQYGWRPLLRSAHLVRVAAGGRWDLTRKPGSYLAAPAAPGSAASAEDALGSVARWHLAAFGPAAAEDIAGWIGSTVPPVRAALERMSAALVRFQDPAGRVLYDLPSAPRPEPETHAPVRFLPWFDSVLLAYAARQRRRILPDPYRELVYMRANLQWLPTFLVDGLVAGTWSTEVRRREAILTLRPFERLPASMRSELAGEGERLLRFSQPAAASHSVAFTDE
jgi:winged helix DNA-binding protein